MVWEIARLIRQFIGLDEQKKRDLASRLGYADINMAAKMLDQTLQTGVCPRRVALNLATALGIPETEVQQALTATKEQQDKTRTTPKKIEYSKLQNFFLQHLGLIIENTDLILATPQAYFTEYPWWFGTKYACFRWKMGELLSLYRIGHCTGECPSCKRPLYLVWGNLNSVITGICLRCQEFKLLYPSAHTKIRFGFPEKIKRPSNTVVIEEERQVEEFSFATGVRTVSKKEKVRKKIVEPLTLHSLVDWLEKQEEGLTADQARRETLFAQIRSLWELHPDWRLGQLLINAIGPKEPCPEVLLINDQELERKVRELISQKS